MTKSRHGQSGRNRSPTYGSWVSMMGRTEWGSHPSFARYGAKGIRVHPRWHTFVQFLEDMGERPPGTSLDRIDNTKGYEPGNCRWATRHQQALNTSRTIRLLVDGEPVVVYEFCEERGLSRKAIRARASKRGNDYVAALQSIGINAAPLPK
jgi:hypothetical protein